MHLLNYDKNTNTVNEYITDHGQIYVGSQHILRGCVEHTQNQGKKVTLIDEISSEKGIMVITDQNGDIPFAAFTNDSERDDIKRTNAIARIRAHAGFHVVMAFVGEKETDPLSVYIFKIIELNHHESTLHDSTVVECIYTGNTLRPIPGFEKVTEHIVKASKQLHLPAQLKSKYCYQTTRNVTMCLMSKDEKNQVVSKRDKTMILNNNSKARYENGDICEEGIFRVYYSRRFSNADEVYVEGVRVPDEFTKFPIEEFIDSADSDIRPNIRILTTRTGKKYYAIVNNKGELRIIIKLGNFTSFTLSKKEIEDNIVNVEMFSLV